MRIPLVHRPPLSMAVIAIGAVLFLRFPSCGTDDGTEDAEKTDAPTEFAIRREAPETSTSTVTEPMPAPTTIPPASTTLPLVATTSPPTAITPPPAPVTPPPTLVPDRVEGSIVVVAYGPDSAHRIDIRRPANPNGLAVLWLHAGGWTSGKRAERVPPNERLLEQGAIVFSADYRLTPAHPHPGQIHDVKRAIRYIKSRRVEFPFETLVVAGGSAGGHLAALAATTAGVLEPTGLPPELAAQDSSVDGAISLSGPMDLTRFWATDHYWAKSLSDAFLGTDSAICDQALMLEASPIHWVDEHDPPLYMAAGGRDTLVVPADNAERMVEAVEQHGDPGCCVYDLYPNGGHDVWADMDLTGIDHFLASFGLLGTTIQPGV